VEEALPEAPPAAAPAPKRSVQDLMRPYYGENPMPMGRTSRLHDQHDAMMPMYAVKLFPHQHMFKWLAYGNGEKKRLKNMDIIHALDKECLLLWPIFFPCRQQAPSGGCRFLPKEGVLLHSGWRYFCPLPIFQGQ